MSQLIGDILSRGGATLVGLLIVVATSISLMRTVVIPRALRSLLSDAVARTIVTIGIGLSRLRRTYQGRDSIMAGVGPTIIIAQLLTWLALYLIGYGLLIYGISGRHSLGEAMRQSGSSLFTLGFSSTDHSEQTIVDFVAAATGPIVIALLIGFLPTIYAVYLEREEDVTLLNAAGGGPAWGPEILARYCVAHDLDDVTIAYREWGRWAARLRLTHVTYPVMLWVRSSRASHHYLTSLLAIMDAASLQLSLNRTLRQNEAYMLLLQGVQALEVLFVFLFRKRAWRVPSVLGSTELHDAELTFDNSTHLRNESMKRLVSQTAANLDGAHELDRDMMHKLIAGEQQPITVTRAEFDSAVDMLVTAGFPVEVDRDEAWQQFTVYRSRYEYAALAIAYRLDATPAPWSGSRRKATPTMWPTSVITLMPPAGGGSDEPVPPEAIS